MPKIKEEPQEVKDLAEEKKFLDSLGSYLGQVESTLDVLKTVYNGQLEELVRRQVDEEFYNYIILAEPDNKEVLQNRMRNRAIITHKRKIVSLVRRKISEMVKWERENEKQDRL